MIPGAIITDGVIVQRLTATFRLGWTLLNESHVTRVARVFHALKTSLEELRSYYRGLRPTGELPVGSRYFPSITSYPDNGEQIEFE